MTNACNGGIGQPQTGAAAVVDYTSGLLAAIFAAYDIAWLIPIIPLVGIAPLTLSTFCNSDLPAVPTFTSDETTAMLGLEFGPNFDSGISKMKDLALNLIWHDICNCQTGAVATLTPPAAPAGTPITQFPRAPTTTPCITSSHAPLAVGGAQSFSGRASIGDVRNRNVTLFRLVVNQSISAAPGTGINYAVQQHDITNALLHEDDFTVGATTASITFNVQPVANVVWIACNVAGNGGTGTELTEPIIEAYCNGDYPGTTQQPCCPPDTSTQSYLDHLLQLVTLIQRQTTPFAYVSGATHTNLSGRGEITVQGLLGAKVNPSAIPQWAGVVSGDPDTLWLDSWINWGNTDGWTAREFLRTAPYLSLPPLCGQFTKIGYSLANGLQVDITELIREP